MNDDFLHWYQDPRYGSLPKEEVHACAAPGCPEPGDYKAPKERGSRVYLYFCLPHVTEYNKRWNYFAGMSDAELEKFQREAITGHRPTWAMGQRAGAAKQKLDQKLYEFLHSPEAAKMRIPQMKPAHRRALQKIGVEWPITAEALKKAYKALAKRLHPDMHPQDDGAEEAFKEVTEAYAVLSRALERGELR